MSKILNFEIQNYKGIVKTRIELSGRSPVVTLIGLNESGKTTVLEAISQFVSGDKSVSSLYPFSPENRDEFTFIPASKKGAFTGTVSIAATVKLEEDELRWIEDLVEGAGLEVDVEALAKPFKIAKEITFENSKPRSPIASLGLNFRVRYPGNTEFEGYAQPDDDAGNLWKYIADFIAGEIPKVAYFPTFLINVPDQILLGPKEFEGYDARHYREIIERIIRFAGYDVAKHINAPLERYRAIHGQNWLDGFQRSPEKARIDAIFQHVSNVVTKEVIGGWRRVLSRDTTAKRIELNWSVASVHNPTAMVSFVVSNSDSTYEIAERSIGFRWFFTFLLLTGFKLEGKGRQKIYVFDEPAANLHSRAQAELLSYFEKMADGGDRIIYSTHSHHMVNPKWLSGAYIVENKTAVQDDGDGYDLNFQPAEINAVRYAAYLSSFPSRSHHFQPVIDRLQYVVPEIVGDAPCVIVEGISDYYALKAASIKLGKKLPFNIIPGVGSGSSGNLISLLMGRGEKFVVLLDDDKEGRKARDRYRSKWILPPETVITFMDVDVAFEGMALEALLGEESAQVAQANLGLPAPPKKDEYGLILAEYYYKTGDSAEIISPEGLENLLKVLTFLGQRFKQLKEKRV